MRTLAVEPLESFAFEAFGWVLGTACPAAPTATAYRFDRFRKGLMIDEKGQGAQPNLH